MEVASLKQATLGQTLIIQICPHQSTQVRWNQVGALLKTYPQLQNSNSWGFLSKDHFDHSSLKEDKSTQFCEGSNKVTGARFDNLYLLLPVPFQMRLGSISQVSSQRNRWPAFVRPLAFGQWSVVGQLVVKPSKRRWRPPVWTFNDHSPRRTI